MRPYSRPWLTRMSDLGTSVILLATLILLGPKAPATEIHFFQRGYVEGGNAPATALTDAAVAAFESSHPDIQVHIVGVPWGKEGDLKLRAALLARRRIDCFRLAHDQLPAFLPRKGRLLAPADDFMTKADRDDYGRTALDAVSHNGHIMAWPLWSTAITLIVNPDLLTRARVELPESRSLTWNEFTTALEQLKVLTDTNGRPIAPFNAASRPPCSNGRLCSWPIADRFSPQTMNRHYRWRRTCPLPLSMFRNSVTAK